MTASYLTLDGFVLELIHYSVPGAVAAFRQRTMNEPGLTHLSVSVDHIHATARKAVEYGGQIIEQSGHRFRASHPRPGRPAAGATAHELSGESATETVSELQRGS